MELNCYYIFNKDLKRLESKPAKRYQYEDILSCVFIWVNSFSFVNFILIIIIIIFFCIMKEENSKITS